MALRWKGRDVKAKKDAEARALEEPMSKIISHLESSLIQSDTIGVFCDNSVFIEVGTEQIDLLGRACFGQFMNTDGKDKWGFQLGLEEAFYLCFSLKCLKIRVGDTDASPCDDEELWHCFMSKKKTFPYFYKAYAHLRKKNWVVRSGSQYGVDFVIYRHHPALVHAEYGVLVLSNGDDIDNDLNGRLRVWSDIHCTTRLLGSVAKTLLVLYINRNGNSDVSQLCLTSYTVEERTITRWNPQQCREG